MTGYTVREHHALADRVAFGRSWIRAMQRQLAIQAAAAIIREFLGG